MKKFIIAGYFVGTILLTYLTVILSATYLSGDVEVKYRDHEHTLSDTEISEYQITPMEGKNVVMRWQTKETRTKKLLGWDTKIDTTEQLRALYID